MIRHATLLLVSLMLLGCQSEPPQEEENFEDQAAVQLSEEELSGEPFLITAQFLSDQGAYSYSLEYDANLMSLTDQGFTGASDHGASFKVDGGAEIVTRTADLSELAFKDELVDEGGPYAHSGLENDCDVEYRVVPNDVNHVVFRLQVCDGDNAVQGKAALSALVEGLQVQD